MKIIITGGAGFIGSHLAQYLTKKKHKVIIIDNLSTGRLDNIKFFKNKVKFVKADISKYGKWTENFKNTKIVFHLAALADIVPSIQNPKKYFQSNVIGTENIASLSIKYNVKKIRPIHTQPVFNSSLFIDYGFSIHFFSCRSN